MAVRAKTGLISIVSLLGALSTHSALALAQSPSPSSHTAGLAEIITAVTATTAPEAAPQPQLQRKVLHPSFAKRLDELFVELLQRPSTLSPEPLAATTAPSAQGLSDMLGRTPQPQAVAPAAFSLDDVVTQSLSPAAGVQPPFDSGFSRRRALVDALRTVVPSDGDIMR